MSKFMECSVCRAKSGTPVLCEACLANRSTIAGLEAEVKELSEHEGLPTAGAQYVHALKTIVRLRAEVVAARAWNNEMYLLSAKGFPTGPAMALYRDVRKANEAMENK